MTGSQSVTIITDPDPTKNFGSLQLRLQNTASSHYIMWFFFFSGKNFNPVALDTVFSERTLNSVSISICGILFSHIFQVNQWLTWLEEAESEEEEEED